MSLKHGILGLLTYGSMSGYDLMKLFNESLNFFWNSQTSQIYRELDSIEKKGWITCQHIIQNDKPNKNVFTLTESGIKELTRWLDQHSVENSMKIRDEMTMRVFFGSNGDIELLKKELLEYKKINERYLEGLRNVEKSFDLKEKLVDKKNEQLYWLMSLKRGYYTAISNINWVEECLDLIKNKEV